MLCDSSVDAKRIILRKGHPGLCFYFLYSGSAFVNVEDTNRENKIFTKTVSTLHRGDSFGVNTSYICGLMSNTNTSLF